jgi:PAS domain S-box-containing protein
MDYRRDLNSIKTNMEFIEASYIPAIAASLFSMDEKQIETLLQGALRLPDIEHIAVSEHMGETEFRISQGNPDAKKDIVHVHPLEHRLSSGETIPGGTLTVIASLQGVYQRLWSRILVVLVSNTIKTFVAAFCILLIIQFLITRHLFTMATYAQQLDLDKLDTCLSLDRRKSRSSEPDELDEVVNAVNDMQERMKVDIGKREEAEKALRQSEEKYRFVTENATDVLWQSDLQGNLTFVSPSFEALTGYRAEEGVGMNMWTLLVPHSAKYATNLLEQRRDKDDRSTASDTKPLMMGLECIHKQGDLHHCELTAKFVRDDNDKPIGITGVTRDITEKKKLEVQLQRAQRIESIGTLAGGIAHDFNNLLMGIQGYASLILQSLDETQPERNWVRRIEDHVKSGAELTRQLLGFARGGKYDVRPTDINELVRKSSSMFGRTKKEIIIKTQYEQNIWTVKVDQSQIGQVLLNLYVNAWQAMPAGGNLYLETSNVTLDESFTGPYQLDPGRYVKISVTDTGAGIDEATQQRIFDPFFTTKQMGRGTGLGLASAYGITRNHDGIINVRSNKGHGCTFDIYLPAVESVPLDNVTPAEDELIERGSETILLVDDEQPVLDVGKELLSELGYTVLEARGGREAIQIYEKNRDRISLVLLDMIMPVMSGAEAYNQIKEINADAKVLLSSGFSIDGEASEILKRGGSGFIQKPFSLRELSVKIREILDA